MPKKKKKDKKQARVKTPFAPNNIKAIRGFVFREFR